MKILHTSDWHLGKKLDGKNRLTEQRAVLDELVEIVSKRKIDVVCVAGDIYDNYMPSAEAETLFYETISKITKCGAQIVIISGNHDDPTRLTASKSISSVGGVYFAGANINNDIQPGSDKFNVKLVDYGDDYFVFENQSGKVYFAALPYPTEYRMKEKFIEGETYEEKVKRYIAKSMEKAGDLPVILLAHVFMLGGTTTDGERPIDLGGARILPVSVIPENCVYTALGHLHKRQVVNKDRNILYSGSIMQYSFDEAGMDKSVTIFDLVNGSVQNLEVVKFNDYKQLYRVSAFSVEEAESKIKDLDGYVEVSLTLDKPMSEQLKELVKKYPNVSLRLSFSGVETAVTGRKNLSDKDLFLQFYKAQYGKEPSEEVLSLYVDVMNAIEVKL